MSISEAPAADSVDDLAKYLAKRVAGRIATPADSDWDKVRAAWNLSVDQRPAMVALPESSTDVAAVLDFASGAGLRVAPQGTGHNASPLGDLSTTILLRTDRMRELTVDPVARSVRVGAGVSWSEVTEALARHGLVGRAGSSGSVGVAGYSLGGGYSWLARRHGLAVNSVTAVDLVTGDGVLHRTDALTEPELFWAVRGGGANVGIVCALEFTALAVTQVYGGALLFPIERAAEVLAAYAEWTRELDESATTCVRLLRLPPMPELPEPLRGKSFVAIDGAIEAGAEPAGLTDWAERLLAPLRALGPVMDTFAVMPAAALGQIHMDPPDPTPARGDGMILEDLTPDAIAVLLALVGPGVDSPLLAVDLRHLGGSVGRPDPTGGAVNHLPGRFLLYAVGITPTADSIHGVEEHVAALRDALAPWQADRDYLNFRDTAAPAHRFYDQRTIRQLLEVRNHHDPDGLIRSNHPVEAV
ncbi:FAD-binding oxidoreductase [Parafrigoribacterium mesophilum]|uniref:FAD-binding oxidoreductase n=1 Tax=Parafrigoribacterium mesophilum TaxID=433646 RepID=UPI0031FBAF7D